MLYTRAFADLYRQHQPVQTGTVLKIFKGELHKFEEVDICSVSIHWIRYLRLLSGVRQLFIQIWVCIWNAYLIPATNVMEFRNGKFKIKFLTYPTENIWTALYINQHSILTFFFFQCLEGKMGCTHSFLFYLLWKKWIQLIELHLAFMLNLSEYRILMQP